MTKWTLKAARQLCKLVEEVAPNYGAHVALTGGLLYKDGPRKDLDLLFYTIRQVDTINEDGLLQWLQQNGFELGEAHGWVRKALYRGKSVDLFFPERYPASSQQQQEGEY